MRACVGLLGVRLEKYRLFYVALTLCFTVSFVGGWLNESFGLGLRYQKLWFGLGLGGGGCQGRRKSQLVLVTSRFLVHTMIRPSRYLQHAVQNMSGADGNEC